MKRKNRQLILGVQSIYYLFTGLWPLFHIASFMEITGCKTDLWLVKTVGILVISVAISLIADLVYRESSYAIIWLSVSSALGLLGIDLYYSLTNVISKMYLIDAAVQLAIIAAWIPVFVKSGKLPNFPK